MILSSVLRIAQLSPKCFHFSHCFQGYSCKLPPPRGIFNRELGNYCAIRSKKDLEARSGGVSSCARCNRCMDGRLPAKNGIFAPFMYKNDHFAKTGSGQT
jgi:hypothetical protein